MDYSFFNDPEYAGPRPRDILRFWDRTVRQLRSKPRTNITKFRFPNSQTYAIPEKAHMSDSAEISTLWNKYYAGSDWKFNCTEKDVERWMAQGFILVLRENLKAIVATFVCRFVVDGITLGGHHIKQAAILDGFVVHPRLRKQGLASYMLAAMDNTIYNMPTMNQSILLWFREHSNSVSSVLQAPISVQDYSYIKLTDLPKLTGQISIPEPDLIRQILNSVIQNSHSEFTLISRNFADPDIYWTIVNSSLVGIADTHRISTDGFVLWEVVFAANLHEPHFMNLQQPIEIAASKIPCSKGVLFATNSKSRGYLSSLNKPWMSGTSGCLSTHVYNWMPPVFITGDVLFAHTFL